MMAHEFSAKNHYSDKESQQVLTTDQLGYRNNARIAAAEDVWWAIQLFPHLTDSFVRLLGRTDHPDTTQGQVAATSHIPAPDSLDPRDDFSRFRSANLSAIQGS
jgi:hypothetical protein